jgi:hypothetical protein
LVTSDDPSASRAIGRGITALAVFALLSSVGAGCQAPASKEAENRSGPAITGRGSELATVKWGAAVNGLALGLSTNGPVVTLQLKNTGTTPLEVMSHVEAEETHLDWYTITLTDDRGNTRTLKLAAARERSAEVKVSLAPGKTVDHNVAVVDWAARSVNGAKPLAAGEYTVRATYAVSSPNDVWNGRLEAGPVSLSLK